MQTLSNELKDVIGRHLQIAGPRRVLAIASALCLEDAPAADTQAIAQSIRPRFEIIDHDQVLDHETGLIWLRDYVPGGKRRWSDSLTAAASTTVGGHKWRAPTIREQLSIVDYERVNPAFDTDVFRGAADWVWTSTPDKESPGDYAWLVNFNGGGSGRGSQGYSGFVRAVRVGQ